VQPISDPAYRRGVKSLKALEAYLGYDQEAQDEAMEISE
jgi:hypothetical protein